MGVNRVIDLYDKEVGHIFSWDTLLHKNWKPRMFIFWCNILNSLPQTWKCLRNIDMYTEQDLEALFNSLRSKLVYNEFVSRHSETPTSELKFNQMFNIQLFQWKEFYLLPFETTVDSRLRVFQYKITHNIIYTNQRLYGINLCLSDKCQRCFTEVETLQHMFVSCLKVKRFWIYVKKRFLDALVDNLELTTNCIFYLETPCLTGCCN